MIAALILVPQAVLAQEVILPPSYEPGDAFIYSNGSVERFVQEESAGLRWQNLSGRAYVRDVNFFVPILEWETSTTRGARAVSGHPERAWPLEQRRRAGFTVVGDVDVRERGADWEMAESNREIQYWRCRAGAAEFIEVPAGAFDAYPIVCDRYSATTMRVLRRQTWYYAPDVGHYIRRTDVSFSSGEQSMRDLIAALPGRQANETRIRAIIAEWREQAE